MRERLDGWLLAFNLHVSLHAHARSVFLALPDDVFADFIGDPAFTMIDYDHAPGIALEVPVGAPVARRASRSIVLKRSLAARPAAFACYVIAHELAHAHLRNEGRHPGEDPEHAADSLAAAWGFPRPAPPTTR